MRHRDADTKNDVTPPFIHQILVPLIPSNPLIRSGSLTHLRKLDRIQCHLGIMSLQTA